MIVDKEMLTIVAALGETSTGKVMIGNNTPKDLLVRIGSVLPPFEIKHRCVFLETIASLRFQLTHKKKKKKSGDSEGKVICQPAHSIPSNLSSLAGLVHTTTHHRC